MAAADRHTRRGNSHIPTMVLQTMSGTITVVVAVLMMMVMIFGTVQVGGSLATTNETMVVSKTLLTGKFNVSFLSTDPSIYNRQ
jgi:hypothetical protein